MSSPWDLNKVSQAFNAVQDQTGSLFMLMYSLIEHLYQQVDSAGLAEDISKDLEEIKKHGDYEDRRKFKAFLNPRLTFNERAINTLVNFGIRISGPQVPLFRLGRFREINRSPAIEIVHTLPCVAKIIQLSLDSKAHSRGDVANGALILFAASILKLRDITPFDFYDREDLKLDSLWQSAGHIFSAELGLGDTYLANGETGDGESKTPGEIDSPNDEPAPTEEESTSPQESGLDDSPASLSKLDSIEQICLSTLDRVNTLRDMHASSYAVYDPNSDESDYNFSPDQDDDGLPDEELVNKKLSVYRANDTLMQVRNYIKGETKVENWENILQNPIIKEMIKNKITTIEAWKDNAVISAKYQDHQQAMDDQLDKFWDEHIQPILERIDFGEEKPGGSN